MDRLPLLGGSYATRSVIASAQRCLNLFPESNPKDSPVPLTHYQRPGLAPLVTPTNSGYGRGIYQASNGDGYCVIGDTLYYVSPSWNLVSVGTLTPGRTNPVSMIDNGIQLIVVDGQLAVDGTGGGWTVNLSSRSNFAAISDPAWTGADRIDYIDTFVIWNQPGTNLFGSTLSNQILPLDSTYTAGKTDYPDPLQSIIVNRHEIFLPGLFKSEIWYDAGNPQFPFAELPGAYVEHGLAAKYSIASADIAVYWLGRDLQGQGMVFRQRGYETKRISNHALEYQLRLIYQNGGTIADAVGYTYQADGHVFYVLSLPYGNQTWVWDESIGDPLAGWHQRGWTDSGGTFNRERGVLGAALYGKNVVIDWENGTLYEQSLTTYTDTVGGIAYPITYLRTFPHLMSGRNPQGQPILAEGQMVMHNAFQLDAETGNGPNNTGGGAPQFSLRWSDTRGTTWGNAVLQSAGAQGQYITRPKWAGLGQAMDRVYEVSWTFSGQVALNGAWVSGTVLGQ